MTNIDQIQPGQIPATPATGKPKVAGDTGSFARLLDQALGTGGPAPAQSASAPAAVAPPMEVQAVEALSQAQAQGVDSAEKVLDLLQRYADMLEGPGANLKQMEPVVEELETRAASLAQLRTTLGHGDELVSRLEEVLSLAATEAFKFRRGDFNPA